MSYSKWALIELLGHRSHYGLVSEVTIAGVQMLRVEIPYATKKTVDEHVEAFEHVHHYSPSALYGLHELTEQAVRDALKPPPAYEPRLIEPRCPGCTLDVDDCICDDEGGDDDER